MANTLRGFVNYCINDSVNGYPDRRAERDPLETGEQAIAEMTRCPECGGDGWVNVFRVTTDRRDRVISESSEQQPCIACRGTGRKRA